MPSSKKPAEGTVDKPWLLKTPPGTAEFEAYKDEAASPPALVPALGATDTLIGEDLKKQVGHPVQGLIIKSAEAKRVLDETKKAVDDDKVKTLHLTLGVSGKDMILLATADGSRTPH